jgi:predicted ATPase with chaperone activity
MTAMLFLDEVTEFRRDAIVEGLRQREGGVPNVNVVVATTTEA